MKKFTLFLAICFLLIIFSVIFYSFPNVIFLFLIAAGIALSVIRVLNYFVDGE